MDTLDDLFFLAASLEIIDDDDADPVFCDCCGREVEPEALRKGFCLECWDEMQNW